MLDGGFPLKKAVTHVRPVKITLFDHENLTFKLTKSRRVNIQKTLRLKTNSKIKYTDGNINKAKTKMLAERDLLLIIILRGRRRENRKLRVCNCFITTKIFQVSFYVNMGTCNLIRFHFYATF